MDEETFKRARRWLRNGLRDVLFHVQGDCECGHGMQCEQHAEWDDKCESCRIRMFERCEKAVELEALRALERDRTWDAEEDAE